ncbi:hypothetical protein GL2_13590 [Microbulbifer sp. GL-2]|nr:hypothetical protein GL2_13590 [Microbulbifer sp. GL-2]
MSDLKLDLAVKLFVIKRKSIDWNLRIQEGYLILEKLIILELKVKINPSSHGDKGIFKGRHLTCGC